MDYFSDFCDWFITVVTWANVEECYYKSWIKVHTIYALDNENSPSRVRRDENDVESHDDHDHEEDDHNHAEDDHGEDDHADHDDHDHGEGKVEIDRIEAKVLGYKL